MPRALLSSGPVPDELAARIAAGPAFWTDWVDGLDQAGLLEELLGRDAIARALAEAPGSGKYESALNAKMTLVCVLVGCLFPGEGYGQVLARAFGLPGLRFWPGPVPAASALSQARERLGEHAVRRLFEIGAEAGDAELGLSAPWHGLEVTAIDGTTLELDRDESLAVEFGSSSQAGRPLLRIVGHVRVASRRWIAAETGTYHQGENELADGLLHSFRSGMVSLADRGFPSMERYLAASATGADLVWRWKNGKDSLPARTLEVLPDGSELVVMRESAGMLSRRRRESRNHAAPRLPDTIARLVTFTILTRTASGRSKTTRIRVLTTLLDHEEFPAREIAMLYAQRWQIEIAFLHLKATVRGTRRELRGQSPSLARRKPGGCSSSTTWPPPRSPAPPCRPEPTRSSSRSPPRSPSSATGSPPTPAACAADSVPSPQMPSSAPSSATSPDCPATGPDASGHHPGPPPNAETATPRTSATPSPSKSRISQNGT